MIPSLTYLKVHPSLIPQVSSGQIACDPNFENLTFSDKLKSIGMIDEHFNLLFTPSEIPAISEKGQKRFDELMKSKIHCCTDEGNICIKQADYISGFAASLKNTGIQIQTYLRGGSAAFVADLSHYFEHLIHEFLASKNLPKDLFAKELEALKSQKEEVPHDVDIFDQVLNDGYPATGLQLFYIEFLKGLVGNENYKKIRFIQRLIPEVSPLFPHPENYILFTLGNPKEKFQTDRIIGKLRHEYLHMRDNIRIKIIGNQMCTPESAGNFWQMVIDRKLKIVRTEDWHEKDFRAGLAAIQLIQDGHILIEDNCSLQSILRYALNIGSEKIFTGALDRARLHSKDSDGFLLSVLIAFSHTATIPPEHLKILMDAIGEIPPLPSLYKYALLQTLYNDKTCSAEWDPAGFLILFRNGSRIIFPKNFCLTSTESPYFSSKIGTWIKTSSSTHDPVYQVLDDELSYLERVLFELGLQKPDTPLTESMLEALVEYILNSDSEQERKDLAKLLPKEFSASPLKTEWVKSLLKYSFKHGLKLWNALKIQMDDKKRWAAFEENILHIVKERPNQSYVLLEDESPPKELRLKLLNKLLFSHPLLSLQTSVKLIEELMDAKALETDTVAFIIQKYKNALKTHPKTYIKFIKQFQLKELAKEWMESFPTLEKMAQALLFFKDYAPENHTLLEIICSLPGLHENELLEALYLKGLPVFEGRNASNLLALLKLNLPEAKKEVLKTLGKASFKDVDLLRWMKANASLSLDLIAHLLEREDLLSIGIDHLIFLKISKNAASNDTRFDPLFREVIRRSPISCKLIPFYQNRGWVKSIYGVEAEIKTKEWGEQLIGQGKLKKVDKEAVLDILSRSKLQFTPLMNLMHFLESFDKEKMINEELLQINYHETVALLHKSVQEDSKERFHHFMVLFELLKHGIASKLQSTAFFTLLDKILPFVPIYMHEEGTIDPLHNLMQTLPLVDFGSEMLHTSWSIQKYQFFLNWLEFELSNDDCPIKNIRIRETNPNPLVILPYSSLQELLKYAHLFKLITEQYIENKVSREEFQLEVRELCKSTAQNIKDQDLMPHENPCLICIRDFSYFLKIQSKRGRAYEAFHYMLKQHKVLLGSSANFIDEQSKYLEIRKTTEDFIISKNKGLYSSFLYVFCGHLKKMHQSVVLQNLPFQDPVLDALELETIFPMNKIEFGKLWTHELKLNTSPVAEYHVRRIESFLIFEENKLKEDETLAFILQIIERLKNTKGISQSDKEKEGISILQAAMMNLPEDKIEKIYGPLEKAANASFPRLIFGNEKPKALEQKTPIKNLPLKCYLEAHGSKKVTDENLLDSYNSVAQELAKQVYGEGLQYYPFYTVLKLVKMGLQSGIPPSDCFLLIAMIKDKAPLFLLESGNQVIFDPFVERLKTLSLTEMQSEEEFNLLNNLKKGAFQSWIQKLTLSEKPNVVSYAKDHQAHQAHQALECLSYTNLKSARIYVDKLKYIISRFISQDITGDAFKVEIDNLIAFAIQSCPVEALTKYNDPCLNAILEVSFFLKNREKHMLTYAAFNHVLGQWSKKMKVPPPHLAEYRLYLNFRRSTEDLIFNQLQLLEKNEILYAEFFKNFATHIYSLFGSYIPENIHINDSVLDALESIPRINKIELLKRWVNVLNGSSTPLGQYQAETITNYIKFESKKIGEDDVNIFMSDRFVKLRKAKRLNADIFNSEMDIFLETAAVYQSPEKMLTLRETTMTMLKLTESKK